MKVFTIYSIILLALINLTWNNASKKVHEGVTAHRGNSGEFPENTIPAFKSAMDLRVDWVELDVFKTKDGKLVVCHDKSQ